MFLTVHATVGALLGDMIGEPISAFGAGFVSHFVLDAVPHGDEKIGEIFLQSKRHWPLAMLFILDFAVAVVLVSGMILLGVFNRPMSALSGALAATLPDILSGFSEVSGKFLWPGFYKFHEFNHQLLNSPVSVGVGAVIQVITFVLAWYFIIIIK